MICDPYFDEFRKEIAQLKNDFVTFKNQPHSTYIDFERWLLGWTYRGENLANAEQETDRYPVNQGGARYTINGNNYYVCAFVPGSHLGVAPHHGGCGDLQLFQRRAGGTPGY